VGGARVFRVHDVAPVAQALRVAEAIAREALPEPTVPPLGAAR
jgi:dihydropteroate synthase